MNIPVVILCLLLPVSVSFAQGVILGSVVYQTVRYAGKGVPIYGVDPTDPTYEVHGNNLALYARREPLFGNAYWAQLWGGPASATAAGLTPVPGTLVHFRDDLSIIRGNSKLRIPGTLGGDVMTFQLRVWEAMTPDGGAVNSWEAVESMPQVARGTSNLIRVVLGNVDAQRNLYVPQNIAYSLEGFGLYVIPEPGIPSLLSLAALLGVWRWRGVRRCSGSAPCPSVSAPDPESKNV